MPFIPKRVMFEAQALEYDRGRKIKEYMQERNIPCSIIKGNRVLGIPGSGREGFVNAKETLVVALRKPVKFASCKPSAHFQLPLTSSCPGMCEYCYLHTTLGAKPYPRVYINIEETLEQARAEIAARLPDLTVFEGAATSDPIPTEHYTGLLRTAIEFFARTEKGRFRFVTKFTDVDTLLDADHNGHTRFRFSMNADYVIRTFEHRTPSLARRIEAAHKVAAAGYPLGFIIGPIMEFEGWQEQYTAMLDTLSKSLISDGLHFELITHRFTKRAKSNIEVVFPESELKMIESERQYKYGQFGYGKYVYQKDKMSELEDYFRHAIEQYFPGATIDYFV